VDAVRHGGAPWRSLAQRAERLQFLRFTMRSTDRRARAAIAGSITTSSFK
jgi:hypothetical protein